MTQTLEDFLTTSQANIPMFGFVVNIILAACLATVLSWVYVKYGTALSNRKQFGKNFLLMTMTTVLIISIVKSSLALSLGLVGALSIIRFRAAIKEPEELAYLFLAIGIGLGFGADQGAITIVAFFVISTIVIIARKFSSSSHEDKNLYITIQSHDTQHVDIENVLEILTEHCDAVDLKRLDESSEVFEASFLIQANNFSQLKKAKDELQKLNKSLKISFLDNKGLF